MNRKDTLTDARNSDLLQRGFPAWTIGHLFQLLFLPPPPIFSSLDYLNFSISDMVNNLLYMTNKEMNKPSIETLLKYVSRLLKWVVKMLCQMAQQALILEI